MLACGPAGHIQTDFTDDLQSRQAINSIDLGQVDPGHGVEIGLYIKTQWIAPA